MGAGLVRGGEGGEGAVPVLVLFQQFRAAKQRVTEP